MEPVIIGYKKIAALGEGSFGKVFHVIDDQENNFAIKIVHKDRVALSKAKEHIKREWVISLTLQHPNIVSCIKVDEDEDNYYFIMECCEKSLRKKLQEVKKIEEKKAIIYFRNIVAGYKLINDKKIIHRDIKPENILIKNGMLKICDMGFARIAEEGLDFKTARKLTKLGSLSYRSYEILKGLPYSEKYDVWCLGITFYEILFGKHPWGMLIEEKLLETLERQHLNFPNDVSVSSKTKKLLKDMLEIKEEKRISPKELFDHDYFKDKLEDIKPIDENTSSIILKNAFEDRVVNLDDVNATFGLDKSGSRTSSSKSFLNKSVYEEIKRIVYIDATRSKPLRKIVEVEIKKI